MKIDKNYFKSETKISSSNRVASVWVYGRGSTLKHYIFGLVVCLFLWFFRFNLYFSALIPIFSVLVTFVLPRRKVALSLQHKPIKTYQNEIHYRKRIKKTP